jgi:hypothetical protein
MTCYVIKCLGVALVSLTVVGLIVYSSVMAPSPRQFEQRLECTKHLTAIALALQGYHASYGSFPPAYTTDRTGKAMHSWRVLILPYLGCGSLYARVDLSEAWDSAKNRAVAASMPMVFRCPSDNDSGRLTTNYLAVVGPNTPWRGSKPITMKEVMARDGACTTILLVEAVNSDVDWMEPRDLPFADAILGVNTGRTPGISSHHKGGANCCLVSTSHCWLKDTISPPILRGLLTFDGGEDVTAYIEDR